MWTKSSMGSTTTAFLVAAPEDVFDEVLSLPALRLINPGVDEVNCCHNSRIGPNYNWNSYMWCICLFILVLSTSLGRIWKPLHLGKPRLLTVWWGSSSYSSADFSRCFQAKKIWMEHRYLHEMHDREFTNASIYMQEYIYICMYVRMYACMYVNMYRCMYVWIYVCMYVYMYVCKHVCMYVCMYLCM